MKVEIVTIISTREFSRKFLIELENEISKTFTKVVKCDDGEVKF